MLKIVLYIFYFCSLKVLSHGGDVPSSAIDNEVDLRFFPDALSEIDIVLRRVSVYSQSRRYIKQLWIQARYTQEDAMYLVYECGLLIKMVKFCCEV